MFEEILTTSRAGPGLAGAVFPLKAELDIMQVPVS